ncbi:hypothetical protein DMN91_008498 [Ooceraea biroi]|uniref:Cytoplasmic tRNA 2-thiolation protein 2 n=1 Tax=Ooceraea biroi TaxID=2015173 RepID=A0A026WSU3_OOCBI|nr:cytoplasmic tRNA 2-thiolation protein 2 [Ooceraea biroi]EZA59053.1 Cytoplasmic tRNA 2-thiolation protein [Ooceraea biroi]RLU19939.1 hypothetical protein DMN91_008498 [Ooceraea biroi]
MCSLNDCSYNDNNEIHEFTKDLSTDATLCRKCRSKDIDILLVGQSGYCNACFLTATNHKFRAALGKSKIIRHGNSVLVDYSGELNSTVLLHLIKTGMSESVHKKLIFKTVVLYIDDSTVMKETDEERCAVRSKIIEQIKDFAFTGYTVSLSEVLKKEDDVNIKLVDHDQEVDNENNDQLLTILAKLPDDTSRLDLLFQLRRKLLIVAARKLNCDKILQADCATDVATKVLANICLGRSAQLSTLANFCDARCADVKILKPMRDFTQQELLHYSEYYKIDSLKLRDLGVSGPATSIQALTQKFTTGLESQFSGTVSVVFRTAEKLSARGNENQDVENNCVLCDAKLDNESSDQVSAIRAIRVSRIVSSDCVLIKNLSRNMEKGESNCESSQPDDKECSANCCRSNKKKRASSEDIQKYLCYSCRLIFRNLNIPNALPAPLLSTIEQRLALRNMRREINDFLL